MDFPCLKKWWNERRGKCCLARQLMLKPHGGSMRTISIVIATNQTDYDLFVAAGSPTDVVAVYVKVNSGVVIGGSSAVAAFRQSANFATGSLLYLLNLGSIYGFGGPGWADGGDAMKLFNDIRIDNGSGQIFGGGGGGQSGLNITATHAEAEAGGGGGGQGQVGNAGAAHYGTFSGNIGATHGVDGSAGDVTGPGSGGAGGTDSGSGRFGGDGGSGGVWGVAGSSATNNSDGFRPGTPAGAAGKAINLNGHTVTWIAGNDSTHVKGAVS
jgi:hypothetical protein